VQVHADKTVSISKKTPDGEAFEFRKGVAKGQREIELVGEGLGDQMERVSNPTIFKELRLFYMRMYSCTLPNFQSCE
jgi:hypothetical protein